MDPRTRKRYGSRRDSARIMEGSITMRIRTFSSAWRRAGFAGLVAIVLIVPAAASAQFAAPEKRPSVLGEQYHVEVSGNFWNPSLFGVISSEQFGQPGSDIDF